MTSSTQLEAKDGTKELAQYREVLQAYRQKFGPTVPVWFSMGQSFGSLEQSDAIILLDKAIKSGHPLKPDDPEFKNGDVVGKP
jgi:hypothetical protein